MERQQKGLLLAARWLLLLVLLSGKAPLRAQALWTGLTVRGEWNSVLAGELEQQVRFNNVLGAYSNTFTEASVRIRPWKHLGARLSYRYTNRPGSRRADGNDRQRWSGEVFYSLGSGKTAWVFTHRLRYQSSRERNAEDSDPKNYLRNRFALSYNLTKRAQPYLAHEWFYRLDGRDETQLTRLTTGLETEIGKRFGLDIFFRTEKERNVKYPERFYVIGLMGTYQLDLRRKRTE